MVAHCQLLRVDADVCGGGGGNGKTVSAARVDSFASDPFLSPCDRDSLRLPACARDSLAVAASEQCPVPPPERCAAASRRHAITLRPYRAPSLLARGVALMSFLGEGVVASGRSSRAPGDPCAAPPPPR
jgi:hypothetical protein